MAAADTANDQEGSGANLSDEQLIQGEGQVSPESENASYKFNDLQDPLDNSRPAKLDFILDIPLEITVELGRTTMQIQDLLRLGQGSVIELTKNAGDTLEILANDRLIAKGDVVVLNDKYGIRLTEVISPVERLEQLK
ncbi:MAG: flagellar motor switch protein FliN [Desulfobacteraceae bacterium]|nr:flagellar motor switch protein FliN [Desulfobacteraceae bacterium]